MCAQAFLLMLPGQRVGLQGLVQASHLNGEPGTVEEAGAERATVRLDSGRAVSMKQEIITTRPRPSPDAAQPGGFEFAAAVRGLGASPLPLAPLPAADARASAIPTMMRRSSACSCSASQFVRAFVRAFMLWKEGGMHLMMRASEVE